MQCPKAIAVPSSQGDGTRKGTGQSRRCIVVGLDTRSVKDGRLYLEAGTVGVADVDWRARSGTGSIPDDVITGK